MLRSTADQRLTPTLLQTNRPLRGARGNPIYWPQGGPTLTGVFTSGARPFSPTHHRRRRSRQSRRTVAYTPCSGPLTRGSCSARTALRGTPVSVCRIYLNLRPRRTPTQSAYTRTLGAAASSASRHTRAQSVKAVLVRMGLWSLRYVIVKRR